MSRTHELKCWPEPFEAMRAGIKTFEWRRDDRGYAVGDTLILRKWDPSVSEHDNERERRTLTVEVTYVLRGAFGVPEGYVAMGVKPSPTSATSAAATATDGTTTPETGGDR